MRMDYLTSGLVNGPFVIFNIVANAFYIFCMVCPLHGERIKQPLKLLLGSLICCTVTYLMSAMALFLRDNNSNVLALLVVFVGSLSMSMSSSVWLNFFYYTQIVPAQRALFIWIKKNIKPIIYCIWFVEMIYNTCDVSVILLILTNPGGSYNFTMDHDTLSELGMSLYSISIFLQKAHLVISLCVMVMSSGSTVVYLSRHIRRMIANGQPLSCPRFRGQVRVTVTGILQGVLYVICAVWTVYSFVSKQYFMTIHSSYEDFIVINLYTSGTTFSLGAGQGVFRQRAADIWLRATQCCKAPKVQESKQEG